MAVLALFGHRPGRLFTGSTNPYGESELSRCTSFCRSILERLAEVITIDCVLTGMALGVDQAAARAALDLGYPVHAYIAFPGMEARWPKQAQQRYADLLGKCQEVFIINKGGYSPVALYRRTEAMIQAASHGAGLWDGRTGGGTWQSISLFRSLHKPYWNFWNDWLEDWSRHLRGATPGTITKLPPMELA